MHYSIFTNTWATPRNRRAGAALIAALFTGTADAQTADNEPVTALQEVTVTARKREENLQSTPISITAFTAAALEARQVTNISDIGKFTPNASFESGANISGSSSAVTMFIRGIGQTDFNLTIDPGVALYVDGVYVSRSIGALLDTIDVESVEVLRGPQGTLFGKNTIGGAVVVTSREPGDDFELTAAVTTGRYDRSDFRSMINVPASDKVKLRASASVQNRDGYVERLSDGGNMGNKHSASGRLSLLIEPDPSIDIRLSVDAMRAREQNVPAVLLAVNELDSFASFHNAVIAGPPCVPIENPARLTDPRCFNAQWLTGSPYETWTDGANDSDLDLWGASLTLDWDVERLTVKSISSYRQLDSRFEFDGDASPLDIGTTANMYSQEQFSQELQLSGMALDERLKWLTGLYYLNEKGTDRNRLTFSIADFLSGGMIDNDSYAAFVQATYDIGDKLALTIGSRYTYEKKRFLPDQYILADRTGGSLLALSQLFIPPALNPEGNRILPLVEVAATARELTPSVTIDYELTPEILAYASYAKGFKSGGFTQRIFPPEPVAPAFDPEYVKSYEIGLKTELFDDRLRLNTAVFYTDYTDLQIIVNEGGAAKVRNAGRARIQGVETEFETALAQWLRLSGGIGYIDAGYREVPLTAAPVTVDSRLANSPEWTATVALNAEVLQTRAGAVSLRGDWSYKGEHFKDATNSMALRQSGVGVLNLGITFEDDADRWTVAAGATNLTNESYLLSGYEDLASGGYAAGAFSRPREWYVRLGFTY